MTDLMQRRRCLQRVLRVRDEARTTRGREQAEFHAGQKRLAAAGEAQQLLQHAASLAQTSAHEQIARLVDRCLKAVFGPDAYGFCVRFERRRGSTEAEFVLLRDGLELDDAANQAGGGVVDVVSFALRVACLCLTRPPLRRLLVLDEPFKHLSSEYRPAVRELVLALAGEIGMQFLLVTHSRELLMGKVVDVSASLACKDSACSDNDG